MRPAPAREIEKSLNGHAALADGRGVAASRPSGLPPRPRPRVPPERG